MQPPRAPESTLHPHGRSPGRRSWAGAFLCVALAVWGSAGARGEDSALDATQRSQIVKSVLLALKQAYVFPHTAEEMERYVGRRLAEGAYDEASSVAEFTRTLTQDLQSVSRDKHLRVRPLPPGEGRPGEGLTADQRRRRRLEEARRRNFGFRKLERLPGNVALLDLRSFDDAAEAQATAVAAMGLLASADAVIFDLRENGGGSPSMIQLLSSYFFAQPVHLNSFYTRATDSVREFWTHEEVEGPRMTRTPLYILTGPRTFSAAEEFTYNLKHLDRATVIGARTGGGAHPVTERRFPALGIRLALPFGRAVNPITKTNWEGTGVEPHVDVPVRRAHLVAHAQALRHLLDDEAGEERRSELDWFLQHAQVALDPVTLSRTVLEAYAGHYDERQVRLLGDELWYQRPDDAERRLTPLDSRTFLVGGREEMRLHFTGEADRPARELVRISVDGRREVYPRRPM